jgi:hypothetical protein
MKRKNAQYVLEVVVVTLLVAGGIYLGYMNGLKERDQQQLQVKATYDKNDHKVIFPVAQPRETGNIVISKA